MSSRVDCLHPRVFDINTGISDIKCKGTPKKLNGISPSLQQASVKDVAIFSLLQPFTFSHIHPFIPLCFNPNRSLEPVQILCIVEHIVWPYSLDVAGYVKRIRQVRCRQANKRWTGSDGNNLKTTGKRSNDRLGFNKLTNGKSHIEWALILNVLQERCCF